MKTISATDARKNWSSFCDEVIRVKPQMVKRTRDHFLSISYEDSMDILSAYRFKAKLFTEDDGTITASLDDFDIVVNGKDTEDALRLLADDLIEYAQEYYEEAEIYKKTPNRKHQFPYIMHVLIKENVSDVKDLIDAYCSTAEA